MGIIRRKTFGESSGFDEGYINLIDSPYKLLQFAKNRQIKIFPLDVEKLAEALGLTVTYKELDEDISGILTKDETKDSWMIYVNEDHHPNRQRYTIAHEIAHFCLHRYLEQKFEDRIFFRGSESNTIEWQANDFAGAILIPEEELKKVIREGVSQIEDLAEKFQVSTLALRVRAKRLGMSGHGL